MSPLLALHAAAQLCGERERTSECLESRGVSEGMIREQAKCEQSLWRCGLGHGMSRPFKGTKRNKGNVSLVARKHIIRPPYLCDL